MTQLSIDQAMHAAVAHHQAGRRADAEAIYRRVLAEDPQNVDALHLLGVLFHQAGQHGLAIDLISRVIQINPRISDFHYNLAEAYRAANRPRDAAASYERVIALVPRHSPAHNNLASLLLEFGKTEEAEAHYRAAIAADPNCAPAHYGLGTALMRQRKLDESEASLRRALELAPDAPHIYHNLGTVLQQRRQIDAAINAYQKALELQPRSKTANNLGLLLMQFDMEGAKNAFRHALSLDPNSAGAHSNLLLALNYDATIDPVDLYTEHLEWARRHAAQFAPALDHPNERVPNRRLRLGYVSADFRKHPVGILFAPILAHHDHGAFEIYCYSNSPESDELTAQLRSCADYWRDIAAMTDEQIAQLIRHDAIDILVDLSGHTARNRLLVFARKPAPIQVGYLGYLNTTGLNTMDYAISHPSLDPDGALARLFTERLVNLPASMMCFHPAMECGEVGELPAARAGHVTFGCMNNPAKVTEPSLRAWAQILNAVPGSRLHIHAEPGKHVERITRLMKQAGASPDRITFIGRQTPTQYYESYQRIDIALDPFPFNGGATSCDALWMGAPIVTHATRLPASRAGRFFLTVIGLPQLVADSVEQYIQLACDLSADLPRLAELRRTLRPRMLASPLMDATRVTRDLETAYRDMWRTWCHTR